MESSPMFRVTPATKLQRSARRTGRSKSSSMQVPVRTAWRGPNQNNPGSSELSILVLGKHKVVLSYLHSNQKQLLIIFRFIGIARAELVFGTLYKPIPNRTFLCDSNASE